VKIHVDQKNQNIDLSGYATKEYVDENKCNCEKVLKTAKQLIVDAIGDPLNSNGTFLI
jgi:hypothetical protein